MKTRPIHALEYGLLRGLGGLLNILPLRGALTIGWLFARVTFPLLKGAKRRAEARLDELFGDTLDPAARRRAAWTAWRNLFFNGVEMMRVPSTTLAGLSRRINTERADALRALMGARAGGIVLAVPHMGNWELCGVALGLMGFPLFTMARRQKNPLVNAWLDRMRQYTGVDMIPTDSSAMAGIVDRVRKGGVFAILPDVRAKKRGVRAELLGRTIDVPRGMALFARESNAPILPAFDLRIGWTRHQWAMDDLIEPDLSLDREEDIRRMTQAVMRVFDRLIRAHPEQYFWFNKRWLFEGALPPHAGQGAS